MKKIRMAAFFAGVMILATVLAGCGSKKTHQFTLELPSNPTTGYTWEVVQSNPIFDVQSEYVQDSAEEGMSGVGGTETFILTPKEKGETDVTFTYGQQWEGGEKGSSMTYSLKVDRKLRVETISMKAELEGNMDTLPEIPEPEIR